MDRRKEGREEVIIKSIKKLYENGVAIEIISKSLEVSIEKIMSLVNNEYVAD